MEITFGRKLLWIAVIITSIAVTTRCAATTAMQTTELSTTTMTMMTEETVFQSSTMMMETVSSVATETESADIETTLPADVATSGTSVAPGVTTGTVMPDDTGLLVVTVIVLSILFLVIVVVFLASDKSRDGNQHEVSGEDCPDKVEKIEPTVVYNPTFRVDAGVDEPDNAGEENVTSESSQKIVHEIQEPSREETTEQAKSHVEVTAETYGTEGEECIVPIEEVENDTHL